MQIGVLNDMSGVYRDISGPSSVACVRQAVQEFGDRAGIAVEVVSADHQNKPDLGSNIARQWFDRTASMSSSTCPPPRSRSRSRVWCGRRTRSS